MAALVCYLFLKHKNMSPEAGKSNLWPEAKFTLDPSSVSKCSIFREIHELKGRETPAISARTRATITSATTSS